MQTFFSFIYIYLSIYICNNDCLYPKQYCSFKKMHYPYLPFSFTSISCTLHCYFFLKDSIIRELGILLSFSLLLQNHFQFYKDYYMEIVTDNMLHKMFFIAFLVVGTEEENKGWSLWEEAVFYQVLFLQTRIKFYFFFI